MSESVVYKNAADCVDPGIQRHIRSNVLDRRWQHTKSKGAACRVQRLWDNDGEKGLRAVF